VNEDVSSIMHEQFSLICPDSFFYLRIYHGSAFTTQHKYNLSRPEIRSSTSGVLKNCNGDGENDIMANEIIHGRRGVMKHFGLAFSLATLASPISSRAVDDDLTRGGVPLTPFNGLAFQYRGNANNGLDASTLNEPSVPYAEFLTRMDKGEVLFVEFMAPSGDAAYVTFTDVKGEDGQMIKQLPIRIGEGYPIEDPEGWSSPAFVVKSVKKKGVPYKFTVPALAQYNK